MADKKPTAPKPATSQATPKPATADPTIELRNKLVKRLAVAGGMVAALLAVLAFFDYLATPPEEADFTVFTRPVPVAPRWCQ